MGPGQGVVRPFLSLVAEGGAGIGVVAAVVDASRLVTVTATALAAVLGLAPNPLSAQTPPEAAAGVVAKILVGPQRVPVGSGVVVARAGADVFVATARHVVARRGAPDSGEEWTVESEIDVAFLGDSTAVTGAEVVRLSDSLDVALLLVRGGSGAPDSDALDLLAAGGQGERVFPVGCGFAVEDCWLVPRVPDVVWIREGQELRFHSVLTQGGHSGGALLNAWGEVVGMIVRIGQGVGVAYPMETVMAELGPWFPSDVPSLHAPTVPRGGHETRVSVEWLSAISPEEVLGPSGEVLPDDNARFPVSLRVEASRRIQSFVSVHLAGLRLAPEHVSFNGLTGGVSLQASALGSRLTGSLFGELGIGQIEGQSTSSGYTLTGAGAGTYVPVWERTKDVVAGSGFGLRLEYVVIRHLAVHGRLARWHFTTPDPLPGLPDAFWGVGVSYVF